MPKNSDSCVAARDVFGRMNFLYQASFLMAGRNDALSALYGRLCKNVGSKAVLKMEPNIKRTLCKRCSIALKPGVTADVEVDVKDEKRFILKCKKCNFSRNFVINPKYKLWMDDPQSVAETRKFGEDLEKKTSNLSCRSHGNGGRP